MMPDPSSESLFFTFTINTFAFVLFLHCLLVTEAGQTAVSVFSVCVSVKQGCVHISVCLCVWCGLLNVCQREGGDCIVCTGVLFALSDRSRVLAA